MVKTKINLICLALLLFLTQAKVAGESAPTPEYRVKAAFLYNFIKFADWPEKVSDSNECFIIGILGRENPFGIAFDGVSKERIRDRKLIVRHLGSFDAILESSRNVADQQSRLLNELGGCHILFVCSSENDSVPRLLEMIQGMGILTVSECMQFLEAGGAINFILEKDKVAFEVNLTVIKKEKIEVRSQLLQIAKRTIGNNKDKTKKK